MNLTDFQKSIIKRIHGDDVKMHNFKVSEGLKDPIYIVIECESGETVFTSDSYAEAAGYIDNQPDDKAYALYNQYTEDTEEV